MNKVALVIIYNHQYNKNIETLEEIYRDRFSNIYHLVPFYVGKKANVIAVYESSYYFQGYVAQGFKSYFEIDYSHYFFIADDLLLNPIINEKNYDTQFKLNLNTSFLSGFTNFHEVANLWPRVAESFYYNITAPGVEAKNQLPDRNEALKTFKKFGFEFKSLEYKQIWKTPTSLKNLFELSFRETLRFFKSELSRTRYQLSYPLVGAYSDIFIVSASTIKQFSHLCGVTATTKLFVEIAIPTCLILSAQEVVTEIDLSLKGKALWSKEDHLILEKYENKLDKLIKEFPEGLLYLHPIKLSKWITKSEGKR